MVFYVDLMKTKKTLITLVIMMQVMVIYSYFLDTFWLLISTHSARYNAFMDRTRAPNTTRISIDAINLIMIY